MLIDALSQITGTTEKYSSAIPEPFTFIPENQRSIALPDGSITSSFLEMFGRPPRDTGLESERNNRPTAAQRLHLLNSSHIQRKIEQSPKLQSLMQSSGQSAGDRRRALPDDPLALPDGRGVEDRGGVCPVRHREQARGRGGSRLGLDQQRGVSLPALNQTDARHAEADEARVRTIDQEQTSNRHAARAARRSPGARRCAAACSARPGCCWPTASACAPGRPRRAAANQAKAKAKAVIQIWMWGGPSHLDTFDPKPEAGNDYCGPLNKPIATNVPGIRIGELLPLLAKQADKYSIIRSMTHGINGHETAAYMVQTGRMPGGRDGLSVRRRRGLAVQGLRRRIQRTDPALHRADRAAGAVFRGGFPGDALQALRHRRRPGAGPRSPWKASSPRASPTSGSRTGASCSTS